MAAWRLEALGVSAALALSMEAACGGAPAASEEDDLTSLTARERKLTFEGYVYVEADAGDAAILRAVREQTQSAFAALRVVDGEDNAYAPSETPVEVSPAP